MTINKQFSYCFENEGDSTLIIRIQSLTQKHPDVEVNLRAICIANRINTLIKEQKLEGILEAIPTFSTVGVYYQLELLGDDAFTQVQTLLEPICVEVMNSHAVTDTGKVVEIPVCYDPEYGIDLEELAKTLNLSVEDIIELHSNTPVRVFMLGFSPGLPYLGLFDEKLNIPRRATPRTKLEAGSIAIANRQCVIYPYETPGGWHIVGRTPLKLFDVQQSPHTLYQAGDTVIFKPISKQEYLRLKSL